jgi:hypothetical protein
MLRGGCKKIMASAMNSLIVGSAFAGVSAIALVIDTGRALLTRPAVRSQIHEPQRP